MNTGKWYNLLLLIAAISAQTEAKESGKVLAFIALIGSLDAGTKTASGQYRILSLSLIANKCYQVFF